MADSTTQTAARFAESIMALPPLPATAQKIISCFGDEFIDAHKVAEIVEDDPGICAKLLGLANSAYFGVAEPVNNIGEAISRVLGVDAVRSLVLAMAIQQSFNSRACAAFKIELFWLQSLLAAECCKRIVLADELAGDTDRDLAYTAGLCHNLGLMALVHMEPQQTNDVLRRRQEESESNSLAEFLVEDFGTDHRILTAELGRTWSLPEPMVTAYQYRAFSNAHCDVRLGLIVAAGIAAVQDAELPEEHRRGVADQAESLGMSEDALYEMAIFGERQLDRVRSLASNMTR